MGVKRQHTLEIHSSERHLDQYVASYDYVIYVQPEGLPGFVKDYLDTNFPDDDWDWHFKIIGAAMNERALYKRNLKTDAYVIFRNERDAFDFWWWLEGQNLSQGQSMQ